MEKEEKRTMLELLRPSKEEFASHRKLPVVVVLDNVRSAHNVGSIFRTADAFALEGIHLIGITPVPPNREIHKTALGATETVNWKHWSDAIAALDWLTQQGYIIVGVEQVVDSLSLSEFQVLDDRKYALVFGNEIHGVHQRVLQRCDVCVEIPQLGTKHSLNVSVSAGIVLWEFFRKLGF